VLSKGDISSFLSAIMRKKRQPPDRVSHNFHCVFVFSVVEVKQVFRSFSAQKNCFLTNKAENLV
jgi:hypothetical protein